MDSYETTTDDTKVLVSLCLLNFCSKNVVQTCPWKDSYMICILIALLEYLNLLQTFKQDIFT